MLEKLQIGNFGNFDFIYRFIKDGKKCKEWFNIFATVTDADRNHIELTDNSGYSYLVNRRDIKNFILSDLTQQQEEK